MDFADCCKFDDLGWASFIVGDFVTDEARIGHTSLSF